MFHPFIGPTGYLVSYPVRAGPSDAYKKQENSCWNNPDFVSTDELIKYSLESKRIDSRNECDGKVKISIKGIILCFA